MKKLNVIVALLVIALMAAPALAGAVVLTGLDNTGVGNYTLSGPGGVDEAFLVEKPGVWVTPSVGSAWIGPDLLQQAGTGKQAALADDPVGAYTYTLTFNVPEGIVDYLVITGNWATDNDATMKLNLADNPVASTPVEGFRKLSAFTIAGGFIGGWNTLTFHVNNATGSGNPSGLLVSDLTATVPEPASVAVWSVLCAIAGIAVWRRRK